MGEVFIGRPEEPDSPRKQLLARLRQQLGDFEYDVWVRHLGEDGVIAAFGERAARGASLDLRVPFDPSPAPPPPPRPREDWDDWLKHRQPFLVPALLVVLGCAVAGALFGEPPDGDGFVSPGGALAGGCVGMVLFLGGGGVLGLPGCSSNSRAGAGVACWALAVVAVVAGLVVLLVPSLTWRPAVATLVLGVVLTAGGVGGMFMSMWACEECGSVSTREETGHRSLGGGAYADGLSVRYRRCFRCGHEQRPW